MKRKKLCIVVIFILVLIAGVSAYSRQLDWKKQQREAEIDRIAAYFEDTFEVCRIPSWYEIQSIRENPQRLRNVEYFLQTEEDELRTAMGTDGTEKPIYVGIPYFPFSSRQEAERIFDKLPDTKKEEYMIISNSIVYYGKCDTETQKLFADAALYFGEAD